MFLLHTVSLSSQNNYYINVNVNASERQIGETVTADSLDPSVCVLAVTCDGGCWNGGECTAVNGVAKCICPSSWSGSKCQEGLFIAASDRPINTAGQSHQMEPQPGAQFISRSPPAPQKTLNVFPGPPCLDRKQHTVFPPAANLSQWKQMTTKFTASE